MPIGTKGAPNFPLKGSKLWTKTLQTVHQMPVEAKNIEKESEPLAAGSCKDASGDSFPCTCLLQTLSIYWPLSAEKGCWIRQAFAQAQYINIYTPVLSKNVTTVRQKTQQNKNHLFTSTKAPAILFFNICLQICLKLFWRKFCGGIIYRWVFLHCNSQSRARQLAWALLCGWTCLPLCPPLPGE